MLDPKSLLPLGFAVTLVGTVLVVLGIPLPHWSGSGATNERGTDELAIVLALAGPSVVSALLAWAYWRFQRGAGLPIAIVGGLGAAVVGLVLSDPVGATPEVGVWMAAAGFGLQFLGGAMLVTVKRRTRDTVRAGNMEL